VVNLTGQNKEIADNAVKDPTIMAEIKATLEDEVKISELIDSLLEKNESPRQNICQLIQRAWYMILIKQQNLIVLIQLLVSKPHNLNSIENNLYFKIKF
jgi:hypothetical protein